MKSGSLNPLEPSGPVMGLLYLLLMNVVVAISSSTYICLKLACIKQTHGGGVEEYQNVSGYSLFVLCGSQHVHSYQFPCFRCSLYLY